LKKFLIKKKKKKKKTTTGDGTVEGWGDVWRLGRLTAGFPARLQDLLDETDKVPPA
jgi:lysophospholipase L1-like esterase